MSPAAGVTAGAFNVGAALLEGRVSPEIAAFGRAANFYAFPVVSGAMNGIIMIGATVKSCERSQRLTGGNVSKSRIETLVALIVVAVGLLLAAILGLLAYMSITATPLHPDPQSLPSVTHSAPSGPWADAVERGRQIMREGLTEQNLTGLSVAVGVGGEIVWAEGFGWADLEDRVPVAPDTRFRIGTASKVLTSAAVALLLERDRLSLDEEIQTYVPEFPKKQWPVTLRQLMGHVAGVRTDSGDEGPLFSQRCERPVEALQHFAKGALLFEPWTRYRYSSYGWILVSAAVEAAADEPFLTFMRKQIFGPLGMDDTVPDSASEPIPNRATPYFPRFAADPRYGLHLMRPLDYSCYAGASVFLSTPSDLVRFGMAIDSGKLLQAATVQLLQTPQRLTSGEETGYGLGWDLETVMLSGEETRVVGHDGELLGGMVGSLMTSRERGIVVAVTSNISYADTFSLAVGVAQAFAR
jgi:serine beta-lactamase-like protein LACTB, mitochondrial